MAIFTENVLLLMTLTKITMCWMNRRSLKLLLVEIQNNFIVDNYNTFEKRFIFMKYTKLAKYYFLVAVPTMTIAGAFYYIQELMPNVRMGNNRSMLVIPCITLGFVGFDCLFTNLAFHITAQFGILSCTIREILDDSNGFQRNIRKLVFQHYKLIRQAESLEDNFNVIILQQLMGTTLQLCISGYNTLLSTVSKEGITLILFYSYAFGVLSTLFTYCYIGECLIQESSNLSNAFYRYEWYNVSPMNLKMVNICMLRMKKPQQLTSGKFFVLSLASFTDILKTTMGYLSVLRTLL
ncbi:odorant receptor 22c-like [Vespa mandarinia]|uniref:odorant receptor 22c-like n=1 Tax=Vespa mandarinia TaxID=7446 RepID=UPI00161D856F|nr:odorant receptor 22c-like [Vespa mandarinia]